VPKRRLVRKEEGVLIATHEENAPRAGPHQGRVEVLFLNMGRRGKKVTSCVTWEGAGTTLSDAWTGRGEKKMVTRLSVSKE